MVMVVVAVVYHYLGAENPEIHSQLQEMPAGFRCPPSDE